MADVVGRLFHEFAITLASTIVISAFVALTLVPMMCARLLRPPKERHVGPIGRATEAVIAGTIALYGRLLDRVLARRVPMLMAAIGTFILTVYLVFTAPTGFFPTQDVGILQGITEAPASVSRAAMAESQQKVAEVLLADKDVVSLASFIGVDGTNATLNSGRLVINLRAKSERSSLIETIARLQRAVRTVPGIRLTLQPVQDLTIDTTVSAARCPVESPTPASMMMSAYLSASPSTSLRTGLPVILKQLKPADGMVSLRNWVNLKLLSCGSASISATCPGPRSLARITARLVATVVLPMPPLIPPQSTITCEFSFRTAGDKNKKDSFRSQRE